MEDLNDGKKNKKGEETPPEEDDQNRMETEAVNLDDENALHNPIDQEVSALSPSEWKLYVRKMLSNYTETASKK